MTKFLFELQKTYIPEKVNKIRPKFILKYLEANFDDIVEVNLYAPSSEIGSLTTLEATLLASFLKIINPIKIFEFGTFLGYSSSVFLKNSEEATVYTLDLEGEIKFNNDDLIKVLIDDSLNDKYLSYKQSLEGPKYLQKFLKSNDQRIKILKSNSLTFDESLYKDQIDFVFVDGGHFFDIIKNDTEKSFNMLKKGGIIVWHDYDSKIHSDVTEYLDELSLTKKIFHIENKILEFHIVE
jgi:predicted O-methyltransferase YrrM